MAKMSKPATKAEAASRDRKADVADHMKRLQGSSRDDLTGDRVRGAASPLGHGKRAKEKR
jgi:hypothetical protein